jgi:tetratricopeptide (TPR) repeat protein
MSATMTTPVQWIESTSWELPFFGLPTRIPWPADVDAAIANNDPFEIEHMLLAIESLGADAEEPWKSFHRAAQHLDELAEAIDESEATEAGELLAKFEAIHPNSAFGTFHRGTVARLEGREEDAIRLFGEAAERMPNIAAIWNNLGVMHAMRGQRDEALAAFQKALVASPNDRTAMEGLAQLGAAVKLLRDPNDPNSAAFVDPQTFAKMVAQQLQQVVDDPDALLAQGEHLLKQGLIPQLGIQAMQRVLQLRPTERRAVFSLTAVARMSGQLEQARKMITDYTTQVPQDPEGFFHLAQVCNASGDAAGETEALDKVLALDPNAQAPLGIRFGLKQGEHDPKKEQALTKYGEEKKSWMAFILASNIARQRGDSKHAVEWAERAYQLAPESEDVLLHYTAALGEAKGFEKLVSVIKPQIDSGKFSKRLDWNYAQVLHQMGLVNDAMGVLRKIIASDVPEDMKAHGALMLDAWSNLVSGAGVPLEVHASGFLQRPVVLVLDDGDGGYVLKAGARLPAESRFPWRASGAEVQIPLQQGQSGGATEPRRLGAFVVRGVQPSTQTIDCHLVGLPDGAMHFRASQGNRRLQVGWAPIGLQQG